MTKKTRARRVGKERSKLMSETVAQVAGEEAIPVARYLRDKKNISEFKIADATKYEVSRVRSMLYKLHERNLVTYYRKKDRKKGWYISYWTFNQTGVPHTALSLRKQKIDQLKERLEREEQQDNIFYVCKNLCTRMLFDQAVDFHFKCPECGELVSQLDNSKTITNIKAQLQELEAQ